jgi:hypothetical protein
MRQRIATRARRRFRAAVGFGVAVGLTACGSGTHSTPATTAAPSASTTRAATTSVTTTAQAQTSTTVSSSASATDQARAARASGSPACRSSQLAVSVGRAGAGLGHVGEPLLFRNTGPATCVLTGYPGVALVKAGAGQVQAIRTPSGYLGGLAPSSTTPPVVQVAPGETISALLEGEDGPTDGSGTCPAYRSLLVTPPNQTVTVRVARPFAVCRPQVHPVVAGTSGRQS